MPAVEKGLIFNTGPYTWILPATEHGGGRKLLKERLRILCSNTNIKQGLGIIFVLYTRQLRLDCAIVFRIRSLHVSEMFCSMS